MRPVGFSLLTATGFSTGMVLFALGAYHPPLLPLRIAGAACAAIALAAALATENRPLGLLGLTRPKSRAWVFLPLCVAVGLAAAIAYRRGQGRPLWPVELTGFCLASAAIGAAEEIAYRGFVQGQLRRWGPFVACVGAAAAHTAYKCSLFAIPAVPDRPDMLVLGLGTLIGGVLFGIMRESLGSVAFPLSAHVAFDIVVYGDLAALPWWV